MIIIIINDTSNNNNNNYHLKSNNNIGIELLLAYLYKSSIGAVVVILVSATTLVSVLDVLVKGSYVVSMGLSSGELSYMKTDLMCFLG